MDMPYSKHRTIHETVTKAVDSLDNPEVQHDPSNPSYHLHYNGKSKTRKLKSKYKYDLQKTR